MTLGEKIVYYRDKKGWTQKALAERTGITPTRLNYWEKETRPFLLRKGRVFSFFVDYSPRRQPQECFTRSWTSARLPLLKRFRSPTR